VDLADAPAPAVAGEDAVQVEMAFSFDWYSSNSAMICRIMTCIGSSRISCVIETSLTPFLASLRT
jgi:hypothetical protein